MTIEAHNTPRGRVTEVLHPVVIVGVSLVVAGAALLSGAELRSLFADDVAIIKLLAGALALVLLTVFFQQFAVIRGTRKDIERHFSAATAESDRMIEALRRRSSSESNDA